VTCTYLGHEVRTYPQYLDADTSCTLIAAPGGSYDIAPAGSLDLPVPPADGLWEASAPSGDPPGGEAGSGEADGVPPPLMTGTGTEGEE
jgi:hypothetical protein